MRHLIAILIFLLSQTSHATQEAKLIGVRIQSNANTSHFVFILNKKTHGHVNYQLGSQKLVVDFANTLPGFKIDSMNLRDMNVKSITTVTPSKTQLRFIFSVQKDIDYKIYFLPTIKDAGERLQLDILSKVIPKTKAKSLASTSQLKTAFRQDVLHTFSVLHAETKRKSLAEQKAKVLTQVERLNADRPVKRRFNVVIDAGHGGKDPGARGARGALEKNIVLNIAKKLTSEINHSKNMRAVLTRHTDIYVPLRKRLELARLSKADLFIAIHADAYFNKTASGVSVYALSNRGATTEAGRWLAQRDNYSELGGVELDALQDRSPLLRSVLIDLAQTATIRDSLHLGTKVLDALDLVTNLHYKYVAQAPFVVLKSPDIPSILVETGFISNPREEKRLVNSVYQQRLAHALYKGIALYVQKNAIFGE